MSYRKSQPQSSDERHSSFSILLDPLRSGTARMLEDFLCSSMLRTRPGFLGSAMILLAFFDECLGGAVDESVYIFSADLASAIDGAESGAAAVLVRTIYAGLSAREIGASYGYYLPDLIKGIDVTAENQAAARRKFADAGTGDDSDLKPGESTCIRLPLKPVPLSDPVEVELGR